MHALQRINCGYARVRKVALLIGSNALQCRIIVLEILSALKFVGVSVTPSGHTNPELVLSEALTNPILEGFFKYGIKLEVRDVNRLLDSIAAVVAVNSEWFQRKYCGFKERTRI
jgi:hypothetical protein